MRVVVKEVGIMRWLCGMLCFLTFSTLTQGATVIILRQPEDTPTELLAVKELAKYLHCGVIDYGLGPDAAPRDTIYIVVGPGRAAESLFPEVDLAKLGPEELVMKTKGRRLLLAGGRPRGTLYA